MAEDPTPNVTNITNIAPTPEQKKLVPIVGPLLVMAGQRKGTIVLAVVLFCALVYWREPDKLNPILAFLAVVFPAYFAAQASEDNAKKKE